MSRLSGGNPVAAAASMVPTDRHFAPLTIATKGWKPMDACEGNRAGSRVVSAHAESKMGINPRA